MMSDRCESWDGILEEFEMITMEYKCVKIESFLSKDLRMCPWARWQAAGG